MMQRWRFPAEQTMVKLLSNVKYVFNNLLLEQSARKTRLQPLLENKLKTDLLMTAFNKKSALSG